MPTLLQTILDSGFTPVTLQESDIGQKFTFVLNNLVLSGTFTEFNNGDIYWPMVRDDITGNTNPRHVGGPNSFQVFRGSPDDLKIKISLNSLERLLGAGDNPLTIDNSNLVNLIAYTKPNGGKRRKTNKKRKMSRRRKMTRRN